MIQKLDGMLNGTIKKKNWMSPETMELVCPKGMTLDDVGQTGR